MSSSVTGASGESPPTARPSARRPSAPARPPPSSTERSSAVSGTWTSVLVGVGDHRAPGLPDLAGDPLARARHEPVPVRARRDAVARHRHAAALAVAQVEAGHVAAQCQVDLVAEGASTAWRSSRALSAAGRAGQRRLRLGTRASARPRMSRPPAWRRHWSARASSGQLARVDRVRLVPDQPRPPPAVPRRRSRARRPRWSHRSARPAPGPLRPSAVRRSTPGHTGQRHAHHAGGSAPARACRYSAATTEPSPSGPGTARRDRWPGPGRSASRAPGRRRRRRAARGPGLVHPLARPRGQGGKDDRRSAVATASGGAPVSTGS